MFIVQSSIVLTSCAFYSNSAGGYGGAVSTIDSKISIKNTHFFNNSASNGGAINTLGGTVSISDSTFDLNRATRYGGSVYVRVTTAAGNHDSFSTVILNSSFANNSAYSGGAVTLLEGNTFIRNSSFQYNNAIWGGGAVYVVQGALYVSLSKLRDNRAYLSYQNTSFGGAMYIAEQSSVLIFESQLTGNSAVGYGGAIYAGLRNNLTATNSHFENNRNLVNYGTNYGGGALSVSGDLYMFVNCTFVDNTAFQGGAIFDYYGKSIWVSSCTFKENAALSYGGALFLCEKCNVVLNDAQFVGNTADIGGAIFGQGSQLTGNGNLTFHNNSCKSYGVIYFHYCDATFFGQWTFVNNTGSLFSFATSIDFKNEAKFFGNKQPVPYATDEGGAATFIESKISFNAPVRMSHNQARCGAAVFTSTSRLLMGLNANIVLSDNTAFLSGGAICCFQCQLLVLATVEIVGNHALNKGGAILMTSSTISISAHLLTLASNTAKFGGAIYMQKNSMITIKKYHFQQSLHYFLTFSDNFADYGGAIFVKDDSNSGVCGSNSTINSEGNCFLQVLRLYSNLHLLSNVMCPILKSAYFANNTARQRGNSVYGGLLDRCALSISSEVLDYSKPDNTLSAMSLAIEWNSNTPEEFIASEPVLVCFCTNETGVNCNSSRHPAVHVKRGHSFKLSLVAVDQALSLLPSNILVSYSRESGLKEGQTNQTISGECSELEYNLYSPRDFEVLTIYAEGPCMSKGLSQRRVEIIFESCTCAIGFQPSSSNTTCKCVCDERLGPYITNCTSNQTIIKEEDLWISYYNESGISGFLIYQFCPYDYCKSTAQGPVPIDLNIPSGADRQCSFNRSKRLCGVCLDGYSLALGSSRCLKCSNAFLALLVPFVLAGISLVAFLLFCNLTIATGSINGLVLYANILVANRSVFLPNQVSAVLSVFIAWMNLDLGIETCFYNGMTMYGKTLLQLVFPSYVLALVLVTIVACEYSKKFASLIGKRNPVATLATLILLSFTKFLRIIITGLSFGHLQLPNSSWETVWLPDANVPFFSAEHAPRFIVVCLVTVAGSLYIFMLLFEKCFRKCSKWKGLKYLNNTKLHAFMDPYYAPFNPRHCYWVGMLLLIRVLLYFNTIGFNSEPTLKDKATLLAVIGAVFFLLLLKQLKIRIYKNWVIDLLETSFLINLGLFAAGTYHILSTDARKNQFILASVSVSIALFTFLLICGYHTFAFAIPKSYFMKFVYTLKCILIRLKSAVRRISSKHTESSSVPESMFYVSLEDMESLSDEDDSNSSLREPDLDILAPITESDWQEKLVPRRRRSTTFSVIEGRPCPTLT